MEAHSECNTNDLMETRDHLHTKEGEVARKNTTLLTSVFLLLLSVSSLIYLLWPRENTAGYIADIYSEGVLIKSIPLWELEESCSFLIENETGGINEIEARPGSIGILFANCPDKICVNQGFISNSSIPITCLPNRLVIQLRPASEEERITDTVTY